MTGLVPRPIQLARKALTPAGWRWWQAARELRRDHQIPPWRFDNARQAHLDLLPPWVDLHSGEVIDLGANVGEWSAHLLRAVPHADLLVVEPDPVAFAKLCRRVPAARACQAAVSDNSGRTAFRTAADSVFGSLLELSADGITIYGDLRTGSIEVDVVTLDSISAPGPVPLIKLDVQGLELEVVRGGEQTFRRATAVLAEVNFRQLYEGGATFGPLHDALVSLGFALWKLGEPSFVQGYGITHADACYARTPNTQRGC